MKIKVYLTIYLVIAVIVISNAQHLRNEDLVLASTLKQETISVDNPENLKNVDKKNDEPKIAPWFVERLTISAGFFVPINNTNIAVSSNKPGGGIATDLDFEDDLGFNTSSQTFLAGVSWRTTRRSRLDLTFYRINRSSTVNIKKDITFGDNTYPINSEIYSFFDTDIYRFSYGYAFIEKPTFELGGMIGAHILGTRVGMGYANNNTSGGVASDFDFTAPLPNFGIWAGYSFSKKWALTAEIDYLALTINDIKGRILGGNFQVRYRVLKNLDLAAGYTGLNFRVDVKKEKADGSFKWGYNGPALTVSYWFGGKKWIHNQ